MFMGYVSFREGSSPGLFGGLVGTTCFALRC